MRAQTRLTVEQLRGDPVLASLISEHRMQVMGAYYSLDSGCVEFTLP